MNKSKFLLRLKRELRGCSPSEIQSRLAFYSEMIDDRVEEGVSEKEAVSAFGNPEDIASQIRAELNERPKKEKRPLGAGAKILIALGSPVWLSLLIAAAAVVVSLAVSIGAVMISLFAVMFAVLICLYAAVLAAGVSAAAGLIAAVMCVFGSLKIDLWIWLGLSFVSAGLCIWLIVLCVPIGKWMLRAVRSGFRFYCAIVFRRRCSK